VIECFTREKEEFLLDHPHPFILQKDDYKWMSEGVNETWDMELASLGIDLDDLDKTEERMVHHLKETTYKIGRNETDLTIHHSTISETHGAFAHIGPEGGAVADIGSTNGTYVNGLRVPAHTTVPLQDKDKVAFGAVTYTFMLSGTAYSFGSFVADKLKLTKEKVEKLTSPEPKQVPPTPKEKTKPEDNELKKLPDVPMHKKKPLPSFNKRTDRLPKQAQGFNVRRHPAAQPMGRPPVMSTLMQQAVEDQFTRKKAAIQREQKREQTSWVLSNFTKIVAVLFIGSVWAYFIYVFLIIGPYTD